VTLHLLETQFSLLDELSDTLYLPVVTHTHGELLKRIEGVLQWRSALLVGQLPEETGLVWPEKSIARTVLLRLEALDMVQYCQEQEALTDSVLESILDAVSSAEDQANKHGEVGLFNDELAQRQKQRDRDSVFKNEAEHQQPQPNTETPQSSYDHAANNNAHNNTDASPVQNAEAEPHNNTNNTFQQEHLENSVEPQEYAPNQDSEGSENFLPIISQARDIGDQSSSTLNQSHNNLDDQSNSIQDLSQNNKDLPNHPSHQNNTELSGESSNNKLKDINLLTDTLPQNKSDIVAQHFAIADYAADHLEQEWQALAETWHELSEHYDGLAQHLGLGWDLSKGVLASDGWRNIIQHRKRIKHSPYLKKLVAALGRLREYDVHEDESFSDTVMTAIKRQQEQPEEITTPDVINDTGGIKRDDDIARMLPSELSLLGHPQLKILWHVKRAERTLLSYQLQGLSLQTQESEQEIIEESNEERQSLEKGHGPIIICLDTSASMQGEPEQIAKALVLEALRIATDEARAYYVYSFGGQKQVLEHELDLSKGGLGQLMNFLQQSFTGGTDVSYALRKALHKQTEVAWKNADILLISDGRFPVDQHLEQKIRAIKKHSDLRIHGVLLGNWRGQAIQNICEPLHRFTDIVI